MNQIFFLFGLYGFGVFLGLLYKGKLPAPLIGISGFLWGTLLWVLGGMVLLTAGIPYTPLNMLVYFIILGIGVVVLHVRNKTWSLSRREVTSLLLSAGLFLLTLLLANTFNYSTTSQDSIAQISTGKRLAYEGLSTLVIEELSLRGIFLSLLQSASVFLEVDYLHLLQPGFSITFLLVFFTLPRRIVSHLLSDQRRALIYALLTSLALFSTYFIVFQFFYVHNSLISAGYLYLAVASFWLGAQEENHCWMVPGVVALLGFSLARNEAPIFALIFLILVISADRTPYQTRLRTILPYLSLVIVWYAYLLARMGSGTKILNPEKTLVIIASLAACGALVLISKQEWVQRWLLPYLPQLMLGGLALLLAAMVIIKPGHMMISVWITIRNTFEVGGWGIAWPLFGFLFALSLAGPRVPGEKLFFYGIWSFLLLLVGIVFFRNPFRLGWGDSGNRMLTHILPITVLYISMKAAQGSTLKEPTTSRGS